jgi:hypothetical protein
VSILPPDQLIIQIYDKDLGFQPTNKSIKPVHIANGLGRWLTRRSYSTRALAHMLRRWVKNQRLNVLEERYPNALILEQYGEAFQPASGTMLNQAALSDLRALALGALAADDAVFDDPDKSSYTLSNERFLSKDPSDQRAGLFVARLLDAGKPGRAASRLRALLESGDDPWTVLGEPMLAFGSPREERLTSEGEAIAALSDPLFETDTKGEMLSRPLRRLRVAFDRLARFEEVEHSKLNSLRPLVLFACFALHVHMLSRWSEVKPGEPRPPILLDLFNGDRTAIRDASRATVRAAGDAVEGLLYHRIGEYIDLSLREPNSRDALFGIAAVRERFESYEGAQLSEAQALTEAYLDIGIEAIGCQPIEYVTEVGRRAGYMTPWAVQGRGGKLQKRYGLNDEFLEVLVAATVEPDNPLEFNEFLDRLRDDYGIVVGRPKDDEVIRRNNLNNAQFGTPTSITEEELRLNVAALRRAIESIGYAKTYADGRTLITTHPDAAA